MIPRKIGKLVIEEDEKITEIEERIREELSKGIDREEIYRVTIF